MSLRATRAKRASSFQCEALEDRSLLNAAIPAIPTAEIHTLQKTVSTQVVQGTLNGNFAAWGKTVSLTGLGNLSVLGVTTITSRLNIAENLETRTATITGGAAVVTSGANTITVEFTGRGRYTDGSLTFTLKGSITRGTRQFKGATGSLTGSGTAQDLLVGAFSAQVTLKVKTRV